MIPKAVGVPVQIEHHGPVQEPVEHGRGDHRRASPSRGEAPHAVPEIFKGAIPLKRSGEPDEIASVATFLAGSGASCITGQTIVVDGGWVAQWEIAAVVEKFMPPSAPEVAPSSIRLADPAQD
jgi:NAD(P)-dependent dehydrogenase (short-subunit alcohol dehydrogenase family)